MKKNKTHLKLTKTTVRVLGGAELEVVQGGAGRPTGTRTSSNDPTSCAAAAVAAGRHDNCG